MHPIRTLLVFIAAAAAMRGQVTFEGYMIESKRPLFVLSSGVRKSTWVTVGQSFDDTRIVAFDPNSEVLTVEKNDSRWELHLREARARSGDIKSRIRPLEGLALAYEIAASGDEKMVLLLRRYQEVIAAVENQHQLQGVLDFMNAAIARNAAAKKAEILAQK